MVTQALKNHIIEAIRADRKNYPSDSKHSTKLGISQAVYSQVSKGKTDRILSDGEWIRIGRLLNVSANRQAEWKAAATPVFKYITSQLAHCQQESTAGLFCDECDVGKTFAAKAYAATHRNVVYVDCSQLKTKQKFIRYIASQFGVDPSGRLTDVIADMVYYIKTLEKPLIILDEVGDLDYPAFLEIKALWNHLEDCCGSYMLGAEALEAKMKRAMGNKKVGYAEIFSRYGARFQSLVPRDIKQRREFKMHQAQLIVNANMPGHDPKDIVEKCDMSLRRIKTMVTKMRAA